MIARSLHVAPCPPGAYAQALEILYRRYPKGLRDRLIEEILQEVERGELDLSGLWIARRRPWYRLVTGASGDWPIVGTLLTQTLAGRAAALWAPEVEPSLRRADIAAWLVRTALEALRDRGCQIIQAVLDESAGPCGAVDLARGGMPHVTELIYLERDTAIPLAADGPGGRGASSGGDVPSTPRTEVPQVEWVSYDGVSEEEFRAVLQATYSDSLDLPELEGVRSLDDILVGHRATGRFVPERWQLGRVIGEPAAAVLLLLSEVPDRDVWEVTYLGLTPEARGRGLGRAAIARALEMARPHAPRIELAVDCRNLPATRLYESAGFVPFDRRSVHLVVFPRNSPPTPGA
jgi:ribosomal protein S18 acetylase RimI-like enzyme